MKQGKCDTCKKCWRWQKEKHRLNVWCLDCGKYLQSTTHFNKWPWFNRDTNKFIEKEKSNQTTSMTKATIAEYAENA